jgi:hypothetical protein
MGSDQQGPTIASATAQPRRNRRPQRRQLFCPAHPEQRIEGNGQKYFLHLLTPEELKTRGMSHKRAQLVIEAYPVLVLSNEWMEELFCPQCGSRRWCHVTRVDQVHHTVRWAPRDLWQQVAHVDPLQPNPTVSEFSLAPHDSPDWGNPTPSDSDPSARSHTVVTCNESAQASFSISSTSSPRPRKSASIVCSRA